MDKSARDRNSRLKGRVTKIEKEPPERIMEFRKLASTRSPKTTPKMIGTTENPSLRRRAVGYGAAHLLNVRRGGVHKGEES